MMKKLNYTFLLALIVLTLSACKLSEQQIAEQNLQLDELQNLMTGTFNSAAQAARDSAYFDITLHMYPIWKEQGHWLYVEQSVTAVQDKPYRQRVYQLVPGKKGEVKSVVYTLPEPDKFIGAWKKAKRFDELKPEDLALRKGCAVVLKKQEDGSYSGSTVGKSCESSLRGASYATSRVTIQKDRIVSWDQGYDKKGVQVWGATKGGYEFVGLPKE
jgi:CpeT protein